MDKLLDNLSRDLAENLIHLRKRQGLSQMQLAKKANIPRSTLTYLESGISNPSLQNLIKISNALKVSIDELIAQPRAEIKLIKAKDIPIEKKSKDKIIVEKLLPDPIPGMEIDCMTFSANCRFKGTPHIERTKEYLYCSTGTIRVYVKKQFFDLHEGDILVFPGDIPHAYENLTSKKAICFSVVVV